MSSIRAILFPTDFSETADAAYPFACSLARDLGAALLVLHVYPPPLDRSEVVARRQPDGYEEDLWWLLKVHQAPGVPGGVTHRLKEGDPVETILRVAREANCDLIVMGTHGRSALGRLLLGSVAEQVLRKASCPVLTLKQPASGVEAAKPPGNRRANGTHIGEQTGPTRVHGFTGARWLPLLAPSTCSCRSGLLSSTVRTSGETEAGSAETQPAKG